MLECAYIRRVSLITLCASQPSVPWMYGAQPGEHYVRFSVSAMFGKLQHDHCVAIVSEATQPCAQIPSARTPLVHALVRYDAWILDVHAYC